ncbi:MAG: YidC/Oxa1 family membrane protein insertase [bacterium]|nr:YidC/Oxa1 family membrane protein insertase [bacterium]
MFSTLSDIFTTVIYQPFFNILVFFYWILDQVTQGNADMGIAVVLLTILIRILLLPLSLSGEKSEAERREIAENIKTIEDIYQSDPVTMRQKKQDLLRRSRGVVAGEVFSLFIQVMITLMLWRIFATGLGGADFHLLYSFMPKIDYPFNLLFLGRFDLTHSSIFLNLLQSFLIFVLETISIYTSPYPPGKGDVVRYQLILPVVSFFIFMLLPGGKKVFIITTLIFSIILTIYKLILRKFEDHRQKMEAKEAAAADPTLAQTESVVVETK